MQLLFAYSHWELVTTYFILSGHSAFFGPWCITWFTSQAQQWTVNVFSRSLQLRSTPSLLTQCAHYCLRLLPLPLLPVGECTGIIHRNKEKLGTKQGWPCLPNQMTAFLLFLYDLYVLFKAHITRMTESPLFKEIGINNKYNIMNIIQGKKGGLGAACQPVSSLPDCGNQTEEGLQLKKPHVLWEPSSLPVGGGPGAVSSCPSLADWQRAVAFSAASLWISSLPTDLAFPASSLPWQGIFLVRCKTSSPLPSWWGQVGRGWDLGCPGERLDLLAWAQWGPTALHPSSPGRAQQSLAQPPSQLRHC